MSTKNIAGKRDPLLNTEVVRRVEIQNKFAAVTIIDQHDSTLIKLYLDTALP